MALDPSVDRGIFVAMKGQATVSRTFMFNPNNVDDTKGISWGSIEVPGASHPVYQFGSGGERLISFELYLDGDRGQVARAFKEGSPPPFDGLSIRSELQFYRSLVYPSQYGQSISDVFPFLGFFTMGELYQNMPVIVKKADWRINSWTPEMRPVRATIAMQLAEHVDRSVTADDILKLGGLVGPGGPPGIRGLLPMSVLPDSRNLLTDVVTLTDPVSGNLLQPPFVDLRQRESATSPDDRFVTVDSTMTWGRIGLFQMGNARYWWVVADLSNVIDPFTELTPGKQLRVPSQSHFLFDILSPQRTTT